MLTRRLLTIPLYIGLTCLATLLLPVLLVGAIAASRLPATRGGVPTLLFLTSYLWCETLGIVASFAIWLRHRERSAFLEANYRLQYWWAGTLKRIAGQLYNLSFEITGKEALDGEPALLLPRHASIADTLIPMAFYAIPRDIRMRYVLKRELTMDPCLDIVGHRLPNLFVDRSGQDSEKARRDVGQLVATIGPDEGVLLYPEGTRFSAARVERLRRTYAHDPKMLSQLQRWPNLLPPRLGGMLALLSANPSRDLVFCAHVGFEGSSHFSNLINGSWKNAQIHIHFWRVPYAEIPASDSDRETFLFQQWDTMQQWVSLHQQSG